MKPRAPGAAALTLAAALLSGCMTTYQPLSGLQRPVGVDPRFANFEGATIALECVSGPALKPDEARQLCRKLTRLFENQGAEVIEARDPFAEGEADAKKRAGALNVRLTARVLDEEISRFLWWKWRPDYSFAQEITIRDEAGFLLAQDTWSGRFTRRWGFSGLAKRDFTADYYGQITQIAFNAQMRRAVLREGRAPRKK